MYFVVGLLVLEVFDWLDVCFWIVGVVYEVVDFDYLGWVDFYVLCGVVYCVVEL